MSLSALVGNLRVLLTANTQQFTQAMAKASDQIDDFAKDITKVGRTAVSVGQTLTAAVTVPLVGFAGASVKAAADFEHAFANVRKNIDKIDDSKLAGLSRGLRDMALSIPKTATELAEIAALGAQFGIEPENLIKFTRTVADLGVAVDGLSVEAAVTGLVQIGKVSGVAQQDLDMLASALVRLGQEGAATEGEILEFGKRLVAQGTAIGLTASQVLGMGSAMANLGINAEAGGTAMSRTMAKMEAAVARGGAELDNFAKIAGKTGDEFAHIFKTDPSQAINLFIEGLGRSKNAGESLTLVLDEMDMKDVRLVASLKALALSQGELSKQWKIADEGASSRNAHTEEARKKYETFWNQLKLFTSQLREVAITVGEAMLPALTRLMWAAQPLIIVITDLAKAFAWLPTNLQIVILATGALVAAIGPLIWMFGQLLISAGGIAAAFGSAGFATKGLVAVLGSGATAASALTIALGSAGVAGALYIIVKGLSEVYMAWGRLQEHWKQGGTFMSFITQKDENNALWRMLGWAPKVDALAASVSKLGFASERSLTKLGYVLAQGIDPWAAAAPGDKAKQALAEYRAQLKAVADGVKALSATEKAAIKAGDAAGAQADDIASKLGISTEIIAAYIKRLKELEAAAKLAAKELAKNDWRKFPGFEDAKTKDQLVGLGAGRIDTRLPKPDMIEPGFEQKKTLKLTDIFEFDKNPPKAPFTALSLALSKEISKFPAILQSAFTGGGAIGEALKRALLGSVTGIGAEIGEHLFSPKGPFGGAINKVGKSLTGLFGNMVGGAMALALPGIGGAIGSLAGPLLAKLGGLFGGVSAEVKKARENLGQFQETLRGTLTASQRAEAGGVRWKEDVIAVRDAYLATGRSAAEADAIVRQLWDTSNPERHQAAVEEINRVLAESVEITSRLKDEQKSLTDELAELTEKTGTDWEAMQAAAEKFGIDIGALGPQFEQARLGESAQELWNAFDSLTSKGADVGGVLFGMRDELSKLAQDSKKFGTTIPENFRPLYEELLRSGNLVDENGEKLQDLGGLNFGDPIVSEFDAMTSRMGEIVDRLKEIAQLLGGSIVNAAGAAGAAIEGAFAGATPAVNEAGAAIDNTITMNSPTGLEGVAHYARLAAAELMALGQVDLGGLGEMASGVAGGLAEAAAVPGDAGGPVSISFGDVQFITDGQVSGADLWDAFLNEARMNPTMRGKLQVLVTGSREDTHY